MAIVARLIETASHVHADSMRRVHSGVAIVLGFVSVLALGALAGWLMRGPRGDVASGVAWRLAQLYSILMHRLEVRGERPGGDPAGPLIIVSNHTAGIDPILIQAAVRCYVRFVMAQDMRHPLIDWALAFTRVIFVDRREGRGEGVRDAIAHVKGGGVLGLFPEGAIERPMGLVREFEPGVGLLVRRTGAAVLPVVIRGTPDSETAWGSLTKRSRSVVEFKERISYAGTSLSAEEIARDLQRRYEGWVNSSTDK